MEIEKFKEKLTEEIETPDIRVDNVDIDENCSEQGSDISETYTEILAKIGDNKFIETEAGNPIEINTEDIKYTKPSTSGTSEVKNPKELKHNYYTVSYEESDRYDSLWNKRFLFCEYFLYRL